MIKTAFCGAARRLFCLLLSLLLLLSALPAAGEESAAEPDQAEGYSYELRLHLDTEHMTPSKRRRMQGYADLLDAITFRGACCYLPEKRQLDLTVEIVPADRTADPVSLHIFGTASQMMLSSPLLGKQTVLFSNDSLLAFATKSYEHLGLKLQYPALFFPAVYDYAFRQIAVDWKELTNPSPKSRRITTRRVRTLADAVAEDLEDAGSNLNALINALEICSGYNETVRAEIDGIPAYMTGRLTGGKAVSVKITEDSEVWSCGRDVLYTRTVRDGAETVETAFHPTDGGLVPTLSLSSRTENNLLSLDFTAGWLAADPEQQKDIISLRVRAEGLPAVWPLETDAEIELYLTGSLMTNMMVKASLHSDAEGHVHLRMENPSGSSLTEGAVVTAEGTVLPGAVFENHTWTEEDYAACVDIFRVNDTTLASFVQSIMRSAVKGLLGFLAGIPASSFQSVMDDLTDSGVLNMLLSVD